MLDKVRKAIRNPGRVPPYLLALLKRLRARRVTIDGEVYYKYKGTLYPAYLNTGNAAAFILHKAKQYCQGAGIDVGASKWPFPGAIPIHDEEHQNAYKLDRFPDGSLDFVFSSHCIEHLARWQSALLLWIRKLKVDGILFLYAPHKSMELWRPGGPWVGDGHKWIPDCEVIIPFLGANGMQIVDFNSERDKYWSFHIVARKLKVG